MTRVGTSARSSSRKKTIRIKSQSDAAAAKVDVVKCLVKSDQ